MQGLVSAPILGLKIFLWGPKFLEFSVPHFLKLTPDVQGSLVTYMGVGGKASQILEVRPVSSLMNSPRLLFLCPLHLPVAHPSGLSLNVSSLFPQEWTRDSLGGRIACCNIFCHSAHLTEL